MKHEKMKKKMGTMDRILIFIAVLILAFTAVMVVLYIQTGAIPDTLCTCFFSVCGGECGVMGWIKTCKERHQDRQYELEDREHETKSSLGESAGEENL